jgi:glycosyltransferase involved in cell wall biosynthesis
MRAVIASPSVSHNDAVSNDVLAQAEALGRAGFETHIHAEHYEEGMDAFLSKDAPRLLREKDTLLIYHHSVCWDRGVELFAEARGPKVVRYHNITPEHFFIPYSFEFFNTCARGRSQTSELVRRGFDLLMSDSAFNALDFTRLGYPTERVRICTPFSRTEDFDRADADIPTLQRLTDGRCNVLFAGRVAPNKGHVHLLKTVYYYTLMFGREVRLSVVGGVDPRLKGYYRELQAMVSWLGIEDVVSFPGKVSFAELKAHYLGAHAFLLLSEHEGFGVPIVEAQHLGVPIVAHAAGAIGETIGPGQLLYDEVEYATLASAVRLLFTDPRAGEAVVRAGRENLPRFSPARMEAEFLAAVREVLPTP